MQTLEEVKHSTKELKTSHSDTGLGPQTEFLLRVMDRLLRFS